MQDAWIAGVDCSYDELTDAEARRLRDAGINVFAQCLWTGAEQPAPRVKNLRVAQMAGFTLIGYISLTASHPGLWHVSRARDGVPDDIWDALVRVPIDVELPNISIEQVNSALDAVLFTGKPADVYTNYDTWVNKLGNPTRREGTGLWNAYWDLNPDLDFPSLPFGGWRPEEVWGEQYQGGSYIEGQFADRDIFRAAALVAQPPLPASATPAISTADQLRGLIAAAFVLSIGNPLSDLAPADRDAVRFVASQL